MWLRPQNSHAGNLISLQQYSEIGPSGECSGDERNLLSSSIPSATWSHSFQHLWRMQQDPTLKVQTWLSPASGPVHAFVLDSWFPEQWEINLFFFINYTGSAILLEIHRQTKKLYHMWLRLLSMVLGSIRSVQRGNVQNGRTARDQGGNRQRGFHWPILESMHHDFYWITLTISESRWPDASESKTNVSVARS